MFEVDDKVSLQFIRRVERVCQKLARACNHVILLRRCRDKALVPKGLQLKFPVSSYKAMRIKSDAERSLVSERLRFWRWKRMNLSEMLRGMEVVIRREQSHDVAEWNWRKLMEMKDNEFNRYKARQVRKFEALRQASMTSSENKRGSFEDCVVNLSSCVLTCGEVSLLSKGLKFAPTPSHIPVVEIVTAVEEVAPRLTEDQASELRYEVKKLLKNPVKPEDNLSHEERKAIKMLKSKEKDIVILKADKGNKTVVMNKQEYVVKLKSELDKKCFTKVKKDPTDSESRKLTKMLMEVEKRGELTRIERLNLTVKAPICPVVYGLPKVHKENVPLRTVFSFVNSPVYLVSKELARILRPLQAQGEYQVKDSKQMMDVLRDVSIDDDELVVSYDVVNLYGSVPAEEAAEIAIRRLEADQSLSERTTMTIPSLSQLLYFCVRSAHFKCDGEIYVTTTCPIGSPLSSCLASIFMQEFEKRMIRSSPVPVILWKRYVDDTLTIVKTGTEDTLLEHLNGIHPSITFTLEKEVNGIIPFLDIRIQRDNDSGLTTTVYRKPTASDRYLDFDSAHSRQVKLGVISCLKKRAETICEGIDLQEEKKNIQEVFIKNGYPEHLIKKRLHQDRPSQQEDEENSPIIRVPYVPGIHEHIRGIAKKVGVKVRCSRARTIGDLVSRPKLDKVDILDRGGVVYRQQCGDCDKCYVGETSRRAKERKREHEKDTREMNQRSAISEHCHQLSHRPNFESFEVIEMEKDWRRRRIKEGIHILRSDTFNRDSGYTIDSCWRSLL